MPQLDLYTYTFSILTISFGFILLYCILLILFSKFWIIFFRIFSFKFNFLMVSNFFIHLSSLTRLNFLKTTLHRLNNNNHSLGIIVNIFLLKEYASFLIYFLLSFLISCILFVIANYLNERFVYREKVSAYECGFEPFSDARAQVNIHFYIIALLFVIFDVEVIYFLPWAINLGSLNILGYWAMIIFNFFLIGGFFYELNRGVFDWADLHNIKELSIIGVEVDKEQEISFKSFSVMLNKNTNYFIKTSKNDTNSTPASGTGTGFFNWINKKKNSNHSYTFLFFLTFIILFLILIFLITELVDLPFFSDNLDTNNYFFEARKKMRGPFTLLAHYFFLIGKIMSPIWAFVDVFLEWFHWWHYYTKIKINCILLCISLLGYAYTVMFEDIIRYNLWTYEEIHFFYEYFFVYARIILILLLYAYNFPMLHYQINVGVFLTWHR